MNASLRAIAIIPARGGSRAIPHKNLLTLCGKPLLAWSVLQARWAHHVETVYVSSDCSEILEIAQMYGAKPILRPKEISDEWASSESALLHALDAIREGEHSDPDLVVFLQATSPLRSPKDIDDAVETLVERNGDSLFSGSLLTDFCLWERQERELSALNYDPDNRGRRQERPPLILENGSIYVFRPRVLRQHRNRLGGKMCFYEMPNWKSHEIDGLDDVEIVAWSFERKLRPELAKFLRPFPSANELDLIVYDFDGVMTDNRASLTENGEEAITINRADGLGVDMLKAAGVRQLILSTETNRVVCARAKKLGLEVIQGCGDKRTDLEEFCARANLDLGRVLYVGNDVNDLAVMQSTGYAVAPADANPAILAIADTATHARGGQGVIRELADFVLGANKQSRMPSQ